MQTWRMETTIPQAGVLAIQGTPFRAGQRVQVLVRSQLQPPAGPERYPPRGKPVRYHDPCESVAEEDWEALG
jgi:hypothetical protein